MNKCLTIEQCKEISKKGRYVNFSSPVLAVIRRDLSSTAHSLWELLTEETIFDSDWSICISVKELANKMYRCSRQIRRLLDQLMKKNYIEKIIEKGKVSEIHVRLPALLDDEFKHIKPRKKAYTRDKNVLGTGAFSFNLYNTTNNNEPAINVPPIDIVDAPPVVVDAPAAEEDADKSPVSASTSESSDIEKLEKKRSQINSEITGLFKNFKNQTDKSGFLEILDNLGRQESALQIKISRLNQPKTLKIEKITIPAYEKKRLLRELTRMNKPPEVAQEIVFSVRRGDLGHGNIPRGISCALKLVRENRWAAPRGMI